MNRIDEIKARVERTPKGPWFWQKNYECYPGCHMAEDDCGEHTDYARHWALYNAESKAERRCLDFRLVSLSTSSKDFDGQRVDKTPMFQFIAHAREDVEFLLSLVDALKALEQPK